MNFLVIVALVLLAVALVLCNSQVARNGGVATAAIAVGVLVLGWLLLRSHGVAVNYASSEVGKPGWIIVLGLAAIIAAVVLALRGASPQTRGIVLGGGAVIAVFAVVFGSYTTLSDRAEPVAVMPAPPSLIPLEASQKPPKSSGRKSSSKSKKSKSTPAVSTSASEAPAQLTPKSSPSEPTPPEPADDQIVAIAKSVESPVTAPAPAKTAPPASETPSKPIPLAEEEQVFATTQNRPAWVDTKAESAADGTYYTVIHTAPKLNLRDALREVEPRMRTEAQEVLNLLIPERGYYRWHRGHQSDAIVRRAEKERYIETLHSQYADADTVVVHVRMAFTPQLQQEIQDMIQNLLLTQRTRLIVLVAGFVLITIGIFYSYLRLDTATKGYYTWRLRFLAIVLLCGAFAGLCGIIGEFHLDDAFESIDWQPVAQAQSGRLRS